MTATTEHDVLWQPWVEITVPNRVVKYSLHITAQDRRDFFEKNAQTVPLVMPSYQSYWRAVSANAYKVVKNSRPGYTAYGCTETDVELVLTTETLIFLSREILAVMAR